MSQCQKDHEAARADTLALLDRVRKLIEAHGEGQAVNYGHVGDLQRVRSLLYQAEEIITPNP